VYKLITACLVFIPLTLILIIKITAQEHVPQLPQIVPSVPKITLATAPQSKILETNYHIFQTFNNCGPAAFSMALRFYGVNKTQQELGQELRPYQNPQGDNDDKSTTLEELAEKSKEYGFIPFHRPAGNIETIKYLITYDLPIITRTWLKPSDDIGHYRIIKGFDQTTQSLLQDDSLQNKNLWYTYDDFDVIWKKFNYEYLVLVPKEKVKIVNEILRENADEQTAWQKSVKLSREELSKNPDDIYTRFNLSTSLYKTGNYSESTKEFEKIEDQLPLRTLWYQIEPILAYYELGNYNRVFEITDKVLNNHNKAFSELYIIRGNIYKAQGDSASAKSEYEKAVLYNSTLKSAQEALASVN